MCRRTDGAWASRAAVETRYLLVGGQRLEAPCRRCRKLRPVDLFLQTVIGFVADGAVAAQLLQGIALAFDGIETQPVIFRRGLGILGIFGDLALGGILLAHSG